MCVRAVRVLGALQVHASVPSECVRVSFAAEAATTAHTPDARRDASHGTQITATV